jgi:hypothetical protein
VFISVLMEASNGTLADEFMLDFEDGEDADAGEQEAEEAVAHQAVLTDLTVLPSNLRTTPRFETVMQEMEREAANEGVNADSFALISKANELAADVVEHQLRVSKYVKLRLKNVHFLLFSLTFFFFFFFFFFSRDLYQERFPELASLVLDNLEYVKTVMVIGNEMDITKVQSGLDEVLPGHMSMIVRIGASTSDGREMGEEKLLAVMRGCNEYIELEVARKKILAFIQSKMSHVAPNLSELVGTEVQKKKRKVVFFFSYRKNQVAALLVTAAGGLDQLSKLHANAIRVLGIQGKKDLMGLSTKTQIQHVGYLLQCDLLKNCASSVRTQAIRTLAGRVALAARVDANAGPGKGLKCVGEKDLSCSLLFCSGGVTVGREYKEEVQAKIEKLLAPLPPRQIKVVLLFRSFFLLTLAKKGVACSQDWRRKDCEERRRASEKKEGRILFYVIRFLKMFVTGKNENDRTSQTTKSIGFRRGEGRGAARFDGRRSRNGWNCNGNWKSQGLNSVDVFPVLLLKIKKVAVEDTGILKGISKKRKLEIAKALEPGQGSSEQSPGKVFFVLTKSSSEIGTSFGRASHLQMQGQKSSLALEGDRGIELVEKAAPSSIVPGAASLSNKYFGNSFFAAPAPKK